MRVDPDVSLPDITYHEPPVLPLLFPRLRQMVLDNSLRIWTVMLSSHVEEFPEEREKCLAECPGW